MELYDINSAIQGYGQNFNALGELGRFMLQRKAQDAQQAQQAYQNRITDADRTRMDAERKLKQEQQEQIRQILLGAQTKTVETPYTEEVEESVQYPDISAFMNGMGGPNLSSRDLNAPAPNHDKPWESPFVRSLVQAQEQPSTPSLAETMTGQKPVEPVKWELSMAPAEVTKRTVTKTRTEQVPNENWMGDVAGKVAAIDPELGMDLARTARASTSSVYTPEQKQLVDAKQQNRISMDKAISSLNEATKRGDSEYITYWDNQVKALKANDQSLNDRLADMGVGGYSKTGTTGIPVTDPVTNGGAETGPVDLDKDVGSRREFMEAYTPKRLADVPTESDIMADAMENGYKISRAGASQIKEELQAKVQNAYSDKETNQKLADAGRRAGQERYDNWLKNTLPSVDKAYNGLLETRNGIASALEQANRSPAGGAYIAMKKVLGDALSNADFAGIAGFGVDAGLIGLLKGKLGATSMNDADAKAILEEAVNGFNTMLKSYEDRFNDPSNPEYVSKAKKAYGLKGLSYGKTAAPGGSAGGAGSEKPKTKWEWVD